MVLVTGECQWYYHTTFSHGWFAVDYGHRSLRSTLLPTGSIWKRILSSVMWCLCGCGVMMPSTWRVENKSLWFVVGYFCKTTLKKLQWRDASHYFSTARTPYKTNVSFAFISVMQCFWQLDSHVINLKIALVQDDSLGYATLKPFLEPATRPNNSTTTVPHHSEVVLHGINAAPASGLARNTQVVKSFNRIFNDGIDLPNRAGKLRVVVQEVRGDWKWHADTGPNI